MVLQCVYICRLNVRENSLTVCSELCPVCFLAVVNVCMFCCSFYSVRIVIVVIMGR